MRSNQEMLAILKGEVLEQRDLFNEFLTRLANGETLDDGELIVLEALKKILFKPAPKVLEMESTLKGVGASGI